MTLNISLVSKHAVFLSGDFRLSKPGPGGGPLPDDYDVQKIIPVIRRDWSALIAYAGLSSSPPDLVDMGSWLDEQTNRIPPKGDVRELPQRLLEANAFLAKFRITPALVFTIVGFEGRRPFRAVVSNCSTLSGRAKGVQRSLQHLATRPKEFGVYSAGADLVPGERERLLRALRNNGPASFRSVSQEIADTNRAISDRLQGPVSTACVVGFVLPSGQCEVTPHGVPEPETYLPGFVQRHLTTAGFAYDTRKGPTKLSWKGMCSTTGMTNVGMVATMIHVFSGPDAIVRGGTPQPGVHSWSWIAGPNEPRTHTFTFAPGPKPPLTRQSAARLLAKAKRSAGEALSNALARGYELGGLVIVQADVADPNVRPWIEKSCPGVVGPKSVGMMTLIETRPDAVSLVGFSAEASKAVATSPPKGLITMVCVAQGGVHVGLGRHAKGVVTLQSWLH